MKHRKGLSEADRQARSQLHQLLEQADGLVHGSLIRMARRCGNPQCRCTLKDQKHESWCLGVSQKGRTRMKHVPKDQEERVRRWVQEYQRARELLETISAEAWKRLQKGME
jgi:hypothetical protein